MLSQLLKQRGLDTRLLTHADVSRQAIGQADLSRTHVVVISYLELTGSPAELRYLIKRVRQKASDAKIVVGLWPEGEKALSDAAIQRAVGADQYVGTLQAAVTAIHEQFGPKAPEEAAAA